MNLELNATMSIEAMHSALAQHLPQYDVKLKKNPIAGFQYIQVYKSAYVGIWIRVFANKNQVKLIKTIPNAIARMFFGGLLVMLIASGAQKRLRDEAVSVLCKEFGTKIQG